MKKLTDEKFNELVKCTVPGEIDIIKFCQNCEGYTDKNKCAEHCVFKKYKEEKKNG